MLRSASTATISHRFNRATAEAYIIDRLESTGSADRCDFDVDAILGTALVIADGWDIESIELEVFWRIASSCLRD